MLKFENGKTAFVWFVGSAVGCDQRYFELGLLSKLYNQMWSTKFITTHNNWIDYMYVFVAKSLLECILVSNRTLGFLLVNVHTYESDNSER